MRRYNPKEIEPKWQNVWQEAKLYEAGEDKSKPKKYVLEYFPYPSGSAMHVGHVRNYTIGDVVSRAMRMQGFNVLHPMGWDAFGLPAENFAIKSGISPQRAVADNVEHFKSQLMQMGFSYDWSREINSTDPSYYRWTQWFFLMLFKLGLAYQEESSQWWCPFDKTVLADEQVENGRCWRCGNEVERKLLKQWFFKIREYADRLDADLDKVDWSNSIKTMQHNWIGKSQGMIFTAPVKYTKMKIQTFSAHFEAFMADTFVVIAPDHPLLPELVKGTKDEQKVLEFAEAILKKRVKQGFADEEDVHGIFTGRYIEDPVGNGDLPIWVASFALAHYGTGIVKCSAHDERDFRFAKKYGLKLKPTLLPPDPKAAEKVKSFEVMYDDHDNGILTEPKKFAGKVAHDVRSEIVDYLVKHKLAKPKVSYKMRDWLISRQRYWGAPIPIIHCQKCGTVPVPEKDLPVVLPEVKSYEPSGDGRSPLANVPAFVNVKCPKCGGDAQRETDTMDGFACSSWYFLRFADPHNDKAAFDKEKVKFWLPVDDYIGGAEHAVMHLLYARFWTKVMFDEKLIDFDEPFSSLRNHGMILAPDGQKMSKSKGNTIEPDGLIEQGYGADSIRLMELFIGPWNQAASWSVEGLAGMHRFLSRVWSLALEFNEARASGGQPMQAERLAAVTHRATKKVTRDIEDFNFNTALAAQMSLVNELYKIKAEQGFADRGAWQTTLSTLLQLLAPFAPHIAEELWAELGHDSSIHIGPWPTWDEKLIAEEVMTLAIQINGKVRGEVMVPVDVSESGAIAAAKEAAADKLSGQKIKKEIYVPSRLVNFVV